MQNSEQSRWFAEEVEPHESSLRTYLRNVFPSLTDIDDLVQETYYRLMRGMHAGRISHIRGFMFITARNLALDLVRRRRIISISPVANLDALSVLEDKPGVAEAINKQQELELLAEAVRSLPNRCRSVVTLRLLYGLSQKEIAAELGLSPHTVKAHLVRGIDRCTEYFEERGVVNNHSKPPESETP